jgi:microcystin-dependent protein
MRLLKSSLQATFPNFTAVALASTQAQIDAAVTAGLGTTAGAFAVGTALLPGLFPLGSPSTGFWSPAANQVAFSISGVQALLMGGTALVTTMSIAAPTIVITGAYSGGTGQLVPIGAVLEWYDDVLPTEGGYCWANGQIIASANTVCPILLARWGSRFGGNGTTTMGVPDRRDTVGIGKSTMGGVSSRGLQTLTNTVLGTLIGLANNVLVTLNLPPYTPTVASYNLTFPVQGSYYAAGSPVQVSAADGVNNGGAGFPSVTGTITMSAQGGTSAPVNNVQPSTTCNYILRLA